MKFVLLFCLSLLVLHAKIPQSRQLIVVTTADWSTSKGTLQRYDKVGNAWQKTGKAIEILLGRNGLGWGIGLHTTPKNARHIKKEGDGKSPAGIFALGHAFGYETLKVTYPYKTYKDTDHCVDDVHSKLYNKIVDSTKTTADYTSFEHMKFPKDYYKYGIIVNHNHINEAGAKKGAGSCIFMHIKAIPTAGCTVMNEEQMVQIIGWLNPHANPLLVQGTVDVVRELLGQVK